MNADEKIGIHGGGLSAAVRKSYKMIPFPGELNVDAARLQLIADSLGNIEHNQFFINVARTDGSLVFAAMTGIEDDRTGTGMGEKGIGANGRVQTFIEVELFHNPLSADFPDRIAEPDESSIDPAAAPTGFEFKGVPFVPEANAIAGRCGDLHTVTGRNIFERDIGLSMRGDHAPGGVCGKRKAADQQPEEEDQKRKESFSSHEIAFYTQEFIHILQRTFTMEKRMARDLYRFDRSTLMKLILYIFLFLSVLAGGTLGYHWIEGWPLSDGLYMTVITVTTVGFQEVHSLSSAGRIFTVLLIFFGVASAALALTTLFEYFVLRGLNNILGRSKMTKQIEKLNRHTIICGYGRTGSYIVRDLQKMKKPFVIIENDPERITLLEQEGLLHIQGDASDEDILAEAGVERAEALVATLAKDADNLFLTLSVHGINDKIRIIARVEDSENSRKFIKAGASQVVSPLSSGANHIVQLLTHPAIVDLIELVTQRENLALEVCEIKVDETSNLANKTLAEARVRQTMGCMVFAVKRSGGETVFDPDPKIRIEPGDVLVAIRKPQPEEK